MNRRRPSLERAKAIEAAKAAQQEVHEIITGMTTHEDETHEDESVEPHVTAVPALVMPTTVQNLRNWLRTIQELRPGVRNLGVTSTSTAINCT